MCDLLIDSKLIATFGNIINGYINYNLFFLNLLVVEIDIYPY